MRGEGFFQHNINSQHLAVPKLFMPFVCIVSLPLVAN